MFGWEVIYLFFWRQGFPSGLLIFQYSNNYTRNALNLNKSILSSQKYSPGINFGQLASLHLNTNVKQTILLHTKINDLNRQLPKIYL